MSVEIYQYPVEVLREKVVAGTMEAYDDVAPIKHIDCGDERVLTAESAIKREDIPARYFGSATGITIAALTALTMQHETGGKLAEQWIAEQENGLTGLTAVVSDALYRNAGIKAHQHSADVIEKSPKWFIADTDADLGCAFNAKLGRILYGVGDVATQSTLRHIADESGTAVGEDIDEALASTHKLIPVIGGPDTKISRQALLRELQNNEIKTPVAMMSGNHCPAETASVVYDFVGYKANANGKDYHHTIVLPELVLAHALPEFRFDSRALQAAALAAGVATGGALGVHRLQIIPADMHVTT